MTPEQFRIVFKQLTDNRPFPWQEALYEQFISDRPDNIPASCNIPTGLGKTSVIAIWLIALLNHPAKMPRRLVYVVNRRTVVDQTTTEVEKLRENLPKLKSSLNALAISTLRGQFADNREWSADPSRPAVICGTVDMIGSRLLFSGYGIGRNSKPHHAGLLGQDVLLVHDEAHLEPAFQELLLSIEKQQSELERTALPWRKLRVMELSATSRSGGEVFELTEAEKTPPNPLPDSPSDPIHFAWLRLSAKKGIKLIPVTRNLVAATIGSIALDRWKSSGKAILIFVRSIDDVKAVRAELTKKMIGVPDDQVQILTGTKRGLERNRLATDDAVFARFLHSPIATPKSGTVYLISTSAGEVGVDLSADHLVCDLTPLDSFMQRLGRVNRRGFGAAEVDVIYESNPDPKPRSPKFEAARLKTRDVLATRLVKADWIEDRLDGSPLALRGLNLSDLERDEAFTPKPRIVPATEIVFDSWSLTTIKHEFPGRPHVEPYLHGIADWDPPQTQVAWREEVGVITAGLLGEYEPSDLLEYYPLKPHEWLTDRSDRVSKELADIADRNNGQFADTPVWLVDGTGAVNVVRLGELADKQRKGQIEGRTVLLPPMVGGLTGDGMLDGKSPSANDVADEFKVEVKSNGIESLENGRVRVWDSDPMRSGKVKWMRFICKIVPASESQNGDEDSPPNSWQWFKRAEVGDTDGSKAAAAPVLCDVHTADVVRETEGFISRLPELPDALRRVLKLAAYYHDQGKRRELFQRVLGNTNLSVAWAKSGGRRTPRDLRTPYRHEFGSLLDIQQSGEFKSLDTHAQDLVLHLIAAHHGRARPHFEGEEVFDPDHPDDVAIALATETPRRFARLQRKFGRWGLAYIESLLRAADHAASACPSETVKEDYE